VAASDSLPLFNSSVILFSRAVVGYSLDVYRRSVGPNIFRNRIPSTTACSSP
jgi:hypothetical protein